jgi:uncharacterized peroxidase-related enzyme
MGQGRIAPINVEQAPAQVKATLEGVKRKLGVLPNMLRSMAVSPALLNGYLGISGGLASGKLGPKLREQIAILIAQKNTCDYCMSAHTYLAKAVGVSQDDLMKSRESQSSDPKTQAALRFASALVDKKGEVSDADWQAVKKAGLSDEEIAEIIGVVGESFLTNFFNKAVKTEIDFPVVMTSTAKR